MRTIGICSTAALLCIALPACSLLVDFDDDGRFDGQSNAGAGGRTGTAGAGTSQEQTTTGGVAATGTGGSAPAGLGGATDASSTPVISTAPQGGAFTTTVAQTEIGGTTAGGATVGVSTAILPSAGTTGIVSAQSGGTSGGGISGVAGAIGVAGTNGTTAPACGANTKRCNDSCVDTSTDKANCGDCGHACEGYQFCEGGRCLPTYVSTKLLAATEPTVIGAAVARDKNVGDLIVEFSTGTVAVTLSPPGAERTSTVAPNRTALARYTPEGILTWGRDLANIVEGYQYASYSFLLASNGDLILPYGRYIPGSGPNPRVHRR